MSGGNPDDWFLWRMRTDRLKKLFALNAPPAVVVNELWLCLRAFYGTRRRMVTYLTGNYLRSRWGWVRSWFDGGDEEGAEE